MTDNTIKTIDTERSLAALIERGGVYHKVSGSHPEETLSELIGLLPDFPSLKKEALLRAVLEREALMSTAIGRGIALPHPRIPILEEKEPFVAIAFPVQPVDWSAPDGGNIHTIFLIVSSSAKQHLKALSKINFLCQQEKFYSLIEARSSKKEIAAAIRDAEAAWAETSR
ncbi:MAG: PTS sugar transporter subunit IIA [Treponema sp.]|jgi:PTS system nitrogen regulatory IIA component|nr:PTS sugar transporter subunit IIA [Treponema sp.]